MICTVCGAHNDHKVRASERKSSPVDAAVCFHCGEVYMVQSGPLGEIFREPSISELALVEKTYGHMLRTIREMRAETHNTNE